MNLGIMPPERDSMNLFEWNSSYSVGIEELDSQHKRLIELINAVHGAMLAKKSNEMLADILGQLIEYTGVHFAAEEQLFARFAYPAAAEHLDEHRKFVEKVEEFFKDFQGGRIGLSIEILDFLVDWLKRHINGSDKKYGPFLAERLARK